MTTTPEAPLVTMLMNKKRGSTHLGSTPRRNGRAVKTIKLTSDANVRPAMMYNPFRHETIKRRLENFWSRVFPWDAFEQWVTHNGRYAFERRTFMLTLNRHNVFNRKNDIQTKHVHRYKNVAELREYVVSRNPLTIHMGHIWPLAHDRMVARALKSRHEIQFYRELTLDIDMDGYDDLRQLLPCCTCASHAKTCCDGCWQTWISRVAMPMIRYMLGPEGWNMHHWSVVYSGRRGIHIWIRDTHVMHWNDRQRNAFLNSLTHLSNPIHAEYLIRQLYRTQLQYAFINDNIVLPKTHKFYDACLDAFESLYHHGHDINTRQTIPSLNTNDGDDGVVTIGDWIDHAACHLEPHAYEVWLDRIAIFAMAPKFDAPVTLQAKHLCKLPLVPHADTRNLTTPIPHDQLETWLPQRDAESFDVFKHAEQLASHANTLFNAPDMTTVTTFY